ncbi:unnamed protein product, partial [Scytosiphon promiscuus]
MKGTVDGSGGGGESVRVIVRLRPEEQEGGALAGGRDMAGSCVLGVEDQKLTIVDPRREEQHQQAYDFSFDRVFGPEASQDDVFETVKPLVHATVDGFTTTVFAYGSTGSGKTHTISGTDENPGVLPRAVGLLFERLESDMAAGSEKAFMVFLTYVEIYNNVFHNLLEGVADGSSGKRKNSSNDTLMATERRNKTLHNAPTAPSTPLPPPPSSTKIEVREHPSRGVFLSGGEGLRVPVSSASAVAALVARGTKSRRTASTGLNDRSSRSHAILILEIEATHSPPSAAAAAAAAAAARGGEDCDADGSSRATTDVLSPSSLASSPAPPVGVGGNPAPCAVGKLRVGVGRGTTRRVVGGGRSRRRSIVECVSIGKMQLIDLAGSERVSMSEVEGSSLVEAQNINLSLTLLGDVLSALSKYHRAAARSSAPPPPPSGSSAGGTLNGSASPYGGGAVSGVGGAEKPFIPYRNSKLTYLLKDSLGGNCKTLMVCAVRAAPACFQQTMMSLRYAGRARDIKNVPHRVLEEGAGGGSGGRVGGGGGTGTSLRGTVDEIELLRIKLVETTAEFERLRGATATGESEKKALRDQLKALAEKNRSEKNRMDELLEGVIHSQKGELEKRKEEFVDLQASDTMDSHAETIERQKERIRDLQTEREAAASAASTARDEALGLRQALDRAEEASLKLRDEGSRLRAKGEMLRIERDSAATRRSRYADAHTHRHTGTECVFTRGDTYRKAVKKMAKEREGLKTAAKEADERMKETTAILAECRKEAEEAVAVANAREEAFSSKEAAAEERAAAAEGRARLWEKKAEEIAASLRHQVEQHEKTVKANAEAERQRDQAAAAALRVELETATAKLSTLTENIASLQRQKAEVELGRELLCTRKREIETALTAETRVRSGAEAREREMQKTTHSLSQELEALRASLSDAVSGKAAAKESANQLSEDRRVTEERLQQASRKVSELEISGGLLKEQLAEARRVAGAVQARLEASAEAGQELEKQLLEKDKEAEGLREGMGRQAAEIASLQENATRLRVDAEATAGRAEHALTAEIGLHKREAADLRNRLELQASQAERAQERAEALHAAAVDEAREIAGELRNLLIAREAEAARSASEASEREKTLLEAHKLNLQELRKEMAEELQRAKDEQAADKALWEERAARDAAAAAAEAAAEATSASERAATERESLAVARGEAAGTAAEAARWLRREEEAFEQQREQREALELASVTAKRLREELELQGGEVDRLRQELEESIARHEATEREVAMREENEKQAADERQEAEREKARLAIVAKAKEAASKRERDSNDRKAAARALQEAAAAAAAAATERAETAAR